MTRMKGVVGDLALVLAVVAGGACSSDFQDCHADDSCPAASEGGEGGDGNVGNAGAGGESARGAGTAGQGGDTGSSAGGTSGEGGGAGVGIEPQCVTDDDCDDGMQCNGVEQCTDDVCQPGSAPCPNANPDHCAITCVEGDLQPICGLEGLDQDGDGHLDAACSQAPGDDCDDSPADGFDVHPDADETCNGGVDDDCDGEDETTDEVLLAGASGVLVAAIGTTERNHVSIAGIPNGGFGVVWADWRAGSKQNIFYRQLLASGTPGNELQLTSDAAYDDNDYPDIVVATASQQEFYVAHSAVQITGSIGVMRRVEVKFDASAKENEGSLAALDSRPQVSPDISYLISSGDNRMTFCALSGAGCDSWFAQPDAFYVASAFHVSPLSNRLVYERQGDLFVKDPSNTSPAAVIESTSETRTNALITENGDENNVETLLAYRYDDGIRVGACEYPDGIPIDLTTTGPESVLLYWNPTQTALYVRVVAPDCTTSPSALVVQEDGTSIGSAALAVDGDGVLAVVWSSENAGTGQWTIMSRVFSAALCE